MFTPLQRSEARFPAQIISSFDQNKGPGRCTQERSNAKTRMRKISHMNRVDTRAYQLGQANANPNRQKQSCTRSHIFLGQMIFQHGGKFCSMPRCLASLQNVEVFLIPSSRNASRYNVCIPSVSLISSYAKRFPTLVAIFDGKLPPFPLIFRRGRLSWYSYAS